MYCILCVQYILSELSVPNVHCVLYELNKLYVLCVLCVLCVLYVRTTLAQYNIMYPDAWAFSINYKSTDRSTFAMYWGTFVMYPSFCKWHYLI